MDPDKAEYSDLAEAVQSYKSGDKEAFDFIYEKSSEYLRKYALYLTRNVDDAEDLFQDTYLKILEKGFTVTDNDAFMSWARKVMYNRFISECRKNACEYACEDEALIAFLDAGSVSEDPADIVERTELRHTVVQAIASLTELQRETIHQFYYSGRPVKWMAEKGRAKQETIKTRLFSARQAVKSYMLKHALA